MSHYKVSNIRGKDSRTVACTAGPLSTKDQLSAHKAATESGTLLIAGNLHGGSNDRYRETPKGPGTSPEPIPTKGGTPCRLFLQLVTIEGSGRALNGASPRQGLILRRQLPPLGEFHSRRHIAVPISSPRRPAVIGAYVILPAWFLRIQSSTSLRTSAASLPARSASP